MGRRKKERRRSNGWREASHSVEGTRSRGPTLPENSRVGNGNIAGHCLEVLPKGRALAPPLQGTLSLSSAIVKISPTCPVCAGCSVVFSVQCIECTV